MFSIWKTNQNSDKKWSDSQRPKTLVVDQGVLEGRQMDSLLNSYLIYMNEEVPGYINQVST